MLQLLANTHDQSGHIGNRETDSVEVSFLRDSGNGARISGGEKLRSVPAGIRFARHMIDLPELLSCLSLLDLALLVASERNPLTNTFGQHRSFRLAMDETNVSIGDYPLEITHRRRNRSKQAPAHFFY